MELTQEFFPTASVHETKRSVLPYRRDDIRTRKYPTAGKAQAVSSCLHFSRKANPSAAGRSLDRSLDDDVQFNGIVR